MTLSAKPPLPSNKSQDSQPPTLTADNESSEYGNAPDNLSNVQIKDSSQEVIDSNTSKENDAEISNSVDMATDKIATGEIDADDVDDDTGTQLTESQITMTSPSPDVVIATVETPDPETQTSNKVLESKAQGEDSAQVKNKETDVEAKAVAEQNSTPEPAVNKSTEYTSTPDSAEVSNSSDSSDTPNDSNNNDRTEESNSNGISLEEDTTEEEGFDATSHTDNHNQDDNDIDDDQDSELTEEEKEQEKVKKEKESKLESYKQFVAEQFSHQKIDYPEVRVTIEANALPSKMYFVMNVLSAIIASYGLIANSAAVVIGAMLVAMMLGPITGVALAIIDYRMPLLRKSLFTVAAGGSLVIFVGFVVGWLHKGQPLTAEVLSRTQPTSMDLMIALAGGTAGAYAMVSPHLSVAVVGVAVATALVPPLAASGILFANGEMQLGLGAALLALTNIIAIQFTNAMVLWFLGFRRLVDDDYKSSTYLTFLRRNAVTLLLLVGLGVYLTINLNTNARQQTFENNVKETVNSYFKSKGNVLTNTQFDRTDGYEIVRAVIRGETTPSSYDVRQIEATITQNMEDNFPSYLPIKLQLRYLPVQVIESNPLIQDKLDQTDAAILTN
ncbi:DUF389 domain-containing protein [Psychrobacter urativorans]|uniref:DUF389 domain-containing protein n=1 Tax=Psychrobacter urativorans TaxID=45610 RepID=UPI0019191491|nr:DUF389 domain-containing protein [Psychrobacter urativorans]